MLDEVAESAADALRRPVPRVYEKLHTGVIGGAQPEQRPGELFAWALEVGRRARKAERAGKPLGWLARRRRLAPFTPRRGRPGEGSGAVSARP